MKQVLADILDSLDTSQLAHQLDKFIPQLEALNLPQSDYSSVSEKLVEMAHLLGLAQRSDNLLIKARKFDELSQLALGFANEYQPTLSSAFYEEIKSFVETSKGYGKIYQGLHILMEGRDKEDLAAKLDNFAVGFEFIAEAIDDYWTTLSSETQSYLKRLAHQMFDLTSRVEAEDGRVEKNYWVTSRRRLRRSAGFALGKIGENESDSSSQPKVTKSSSLLPFLTHKGRNEEEQIQKNQPAMALLKLWLEERVEKQNVQSEQEAVESLKRAMDENRPIGAKLFD